MEIMDVFRGDAFTAQSLTSIVERNPFNPQLLGSLPIFDPDPIRTTAVAVEEQDGALVLIPTTPRGAPATERTTERRRVRYFEVPRLFHGDTIRAHELQNIRDYVGTDGNVVTVFKQLQSEVAKRLSGPTGIQRNIEYTKEFHRLNCIKGIMLDSDASTLFNWFTEFGVSPPATVFFNLAAGATAVTGTIGPKCNEVIRGMARAAKGAFTSSTRVYALCGDEFFDQFINHMDVRTTYLNWTAAQALRTQVNLGDTGGFGEFTFGNITWINYRGSDDTTTIAVAADKAHFFPVNAPGIFKVAYAPGESFDQINQPGIPLSIQSIMDKDRNQWFRLEGTSYPLHMCTRPEVLFTGDDDAS